jgi:solute carrier family 25 (mitochondrial citrate transporter), member 1
LYRGYSALLAFTMPNSAVRFGGFQFASDNFFNGERTTMTNFASGIFAGACSATFTQTPKETIKTKLIHDRLSAKPRYGNFFHGVYTILKEHGVSGIYKGYPAVLIKDSSN